MLKRIQVASPRFLTSLSTAAAVHNRALVYTQNGDPAEVLRVIDYPPLPPPPPQTANIRFLLSPVNPADVNVVEGAYPIKATPTQGPGNTQEKHIFIGGSEGLAKVVKTGDGVVELQEGDWVVMTKSQSGTWCSERNVQTNDVLKLPLTQGLTDVQAATMTVNPPTAYNLLHEFIDLERGDWIVQNGANSAVGQAVIQIAASRGINSFNFVRNRDDYGVLKEQLLQLGATYVMTYDDLNNKYTWEKIKSLTSGKIRLGLNCIGGKDTMLMARLLGNDSHLVSYGAMSKEPLCLPTSLFIFKNITAHGFWQSRWYRERPRHVQEALLHKITQLILENKLSTPSYEIVLIPNQEPCEQATNRLRAVFSKLLKGRYGKKVLLKFQSDSNI